MLWQRALTAAVGIPLALLLIYLGGWWLVGLTALLATLALRECYRLIAAIANRFSAPPPPLPLAATSACGYLLAVAVPAAALPGKAMSLPHFARDVAILSLFAMGIAVLLALAAPAGRTRRSIPYLGIPAAALLLPALFASLVHLRLLEGKPLAPLPPTIQPGACWLFLIVAACWAMDTAAYAVGKTWGRRKLWPAVSPNKTVEGSVAGLLASIALVAAFGRLLGLQLHFGILLGGLLGVAGQLGDLAESKLKRLAGAKDSGSLLPGHGGVLDRFDSLLANAPLAYYFLRMVL